MQDLNSTSHQETDRDDLNTSTIASIGFLSAILLFVLIIGMQVLYYKFQEAEFNSKILAQKPAELTKAVSDQQEKLNGYRWIDEAKGTVAIPIDVAMDLIVKENR